MLLFGEDGANWSKYYSTAFIISGKTWVNNHAHVMRCVNVNIYYLKNYFEKNDYNIYALGNAPAKINLDTFKNIIINIPRSLEEQEKIGNLFKLIDEEIELLENEVRELKQKKKYYLSVMM